MTVYLKIRNWERWQSWRGDRGQPPWIKLHRNVMRNPEWVSMTDAQRGQLVAIWLLAADHAGAIPASPAVLRKLCHLDSEPDLNLLVELGFIEPSPEWRQADANVAPPCHPVDPLEEKRIEKKKKRKEEDAPRPKSDATPVVFELPLINGESHPVTEQDCSRYGELYPGLDVNIEIRRMIGWLEAHPANRKTPGGIKRFINSWLSRAQDRARAPITAGMATGVDGRAARNQEAFRAVLAKLGGGDDEDVYPCAVAAGRGVQRTDDRDQD